MAPQQTKGYPRNIPVRSLSSQPNRHVGVPIITDKGPSAIASTDVPTKRLNSESRSNRAHTQLQSSDATENSVIKRPFQASVESDADDDTPCFDDDSSERISSAHYSIESESGSFTPPVRNTDSGHAPERCLPHCQSKAPAAHSVENGMLTPPSSADSSLKQRPTVHFSNRPVLLHYRRGGNDCEEPAQSQHEYISVGNKPVLPAVDTQYRQPYMNAEPIINLKNILREMASYMIRQYEPRDSLVLPPCKLETLYNIYKVDAEPLLSHNIFGLKSRNAMRNLELLYQDLRCEYHLIQDDRNDRPYIPALTPDGFVTWFTNFIQAAPGSELQRLQHMVADIPVEIEGHDTGRQKTLKYLPRQTFPDKPNRGVLRAVADSLDDWQKRTRSFSTPEHPSPALATSPDDAIAERSDSNGRVKSNSRVKRLPSRQKYSGQRREVGDTGHNNPRSDSIELQGRHISERQHYDYESRHKGIKSRLVIHDDHRDGRHEYAARRQEPKSKHNIPQAAKTRRQSPMQPSIDVYANPSPPSSNPTTPQGSPSRKDSYRYFQGRASARGPRYDDLIEISRR